MPQSLSKILEIDSSELTNRGAFDPILDLDTRLFIDPHLLRYTSVPEFSHSYEKLHEHFRKIAKLILASEQIGDPFWTSADRMMKWPEVKGLCIGYSKEGTSGSGIGPELRERLLTTARVILEKGKNDLEIFELVGLLEKDFGPDRISDMTANVIVEDLTRFTKRVLDDLPVDWNSKLEIDKKSGLPINPFTAQKLFLVPRQLLRDLPVALDWSYADLIARHNQVLRDQVNDLIGHSWKEATKNLSKNELKKVILENPELIDDLIHLYKNKPEQPYNFEHDRAGEYLWYLASQKASQENPLKLSLASNPSSEEVQELILKICEQFKTLIEDNGWWRLIYNENGAPKRETALQLLFYGVCESYCDANKIMISRECDAGRGPVDFKFGSNCENSILVEIKKSTNTSGLKKGIEKQLPQYMKSEKSRRAIYMVVDVGYTKAARENLAEINKLTSGAEIKIFYIDGMQKKSASKL